MRVSVCALRQGHPGAVRRQDRQARIQGANSISTRERFTSSPWAYDGRIFCLSEEGKTYVMAAGDTFQLLGVNPLDEMALASPAIVGDRLLIRTESRLYSIRRAGRR